ncbi:MAG: cytochrome P450 [Halieaceae bacterium]|jgi:cytochrome P450|nr:cytochrome P450 [Halieaceae bacterium]
MNSPEAVTLVDPYSIDIKDLDPSDGLLFQHQAHWDYFKRLREEDPVHFVNSEEFGPYWSITKFQDIMFVDSHHDLFSNVPSIVLGEPELDFEPPMFIAMDPPKHDVQRAAVTPAVKPMRLQEMEGLIRERVIEILDALPIGEEFNWVDKVSIELTTRMLATLFDFPFEDRSLLTYWSDVTTSAPSVGSLAITEEERRDILMECLAYFSKLWEERKAAPPKNDFISLLAHNPDTRDMEPLEYLGNLMLLIVGGNDTTRNSMTGGVLALHDNPEEFAKLKADTSLIPNMVSEIIRWQTPLGHMRRIAKEDVELGGKTIKKGDKVVMWYISGNRDAEAIDNPDSFIIDRAKARHHVSFGFGIHRCMGNRLGEMQLRIVWEEIMARFERIEVVGEPERVASNFVMGFKTLPVILHAKKTDA